MLSQRDPFDHENSLKKFAYVPVILTEGFEGERFATQALLAV